MSKITSNRLIEGEKMIKGINKRIIEVNDTGSEYFEKVLFIVKDNKADLKKLKNEADRVVNAYFPKNDFVFKEGYLRRRKTKLKGIITILCITLLVVIIVSGIAIKVLY